MRLCSYRSWCGQTVMKDQLDSTQTEGAWVEPVKHTQPYTVKSSREAFPPRTHQLLKVCSAVYSPGHRHRNSTGIPFCMLFLEGHIFRFQYQACTSVQRKSNTMDPKMNTDSTVSAFLSLFLKMMSKYGLPMPKWRQMCFNKTSWYLSISWWFLDL